MKIRKANSKDFEEVAIIFKEGFNEIPYKEKWTNDSALKKIKEYSETQEIFVAILNNKVIGFIITCVNLWHGGKEGSIESFVVKKEFQGKGVGDELLKYLEENYKKQGINLIQLYINTNAPAFEFYKKRNYTKTHMVVIEKELK